ncbi:MAG: hypothetical protein DMF06_13450 [Verrucomicrobia bacterium]|nr:MAG: hypothetical protein DMF06_13450 [Verrucomicrobiota bacterium]
MSKHLRFHPVRICSVALAGLFLGFFVPQAVAVSPNIVISQVYGGAGCATAGCSTYQNDFIELFNRGSSPVSVNGWSVQYAAATGTTWQVTNLPNVSIPAGGYFLVAESFSANGVSSLPTPDVTGTIAMSATAGKVAVVNSTSALTGACPVSGSIVDFVGYGATADCNESANAPAPSTTTADIRGANGCTDTDNNSTDFQSLSPNPRNSSHAVNLCSSPSTPTPTPGVTPASPTPSPPATPAPTPTPGSTRIHDIQGAAHLSPRTGQTVASVPGIVTAKVSNGFFLQDPSPDANDATSEGIFVFTSSAPTVNVGDSLLVGGTVAEFRSGGASSTNLTTTEISSPTISVQSTGNPLPPPIIIGTGGRIPPTTVIDDDATGSVETSGTFDAATDGIDFYESLEGMRVQINNPVAVGPLNSFGEIPVLSDNGVNTSIRTTRGGIVVRSNDFNPERVFLDDAIAATPTVSVGDHFSGPAVGVLDYTAGNFKLHITQALTAVSGGLAREITAVPTATQLAVATFNVENLDPGDPPSKFTALASLIVNNLRSPDIIAVEEIQDNNGPTDNGVVDATTTFNTLIAAIQTAGGPTYLFRQINPVNDQDGGEPGGNIRVGFLFRTDRGLAFIDRPGGCSTCATTVANGPTGVELSFSPGRVDPTNAAFNSSRKPLAGEFTFSGQKLILIANHFNSKGGDDPLFGRFQPPVLSSEVQRTQQAQIVNNFVDSILALNASAKIVVLGDLNDFPFSTPINTLKGGVLHALIETLPESERYTYEFDGNAQALDHILVSDNLFSGPFDYDVVHVNAEFVDQISDHDPQVVRLALTGGPTPTPTITPPPTPTATATASATATATATASPSPSSPGSPTPPATPTATATATVAPSPSPTCGPSFLYALNDDPAGDKVYGFQVNEGTGALTALAGFPVAAGAGGTGLVSERMVIDSLNRRLYVINDGSDSISAYSINPVTGAISPLPFSPIPLSAGSWNTIAIHPSGSPLIVSNGGTGGGVLSYNITPFSATLATGTPFPVGGPTAFSSVLSRDGNYFYVGGNTGTAVAGFSVNTATGVLTTLAGSPFDTGAANPIAFAMDSTGRFFTTTDTNDVRIFTSSSGVLSSVTGNPFPTGTTAHRFGIIHPNQNFYLLAGSNNNTVGVFRISGIGAATTLAPVAGSPFGTGGTTANALAINQTGSVLYLANRVSRNITTFSVNAGTGALTSLGVQPNNTLGTAGAINGIAYLAAQGGGCPSPTPTATVGPTITPTATPTTSPSATPSPTATPPNTPPPSTATPTATVAPSANPSASPSATPEVSPSATPPTQAINLSTRLRVQTDNNVGIGGFIITGSAPKQLLLRAIGPSLTNFGVPGVLADPVMELHGPGAFITITNNNWRDTQEAEIQATGIPPTDNLESAILVTLSPGAYTAIVRGNNGTSGVGLIEIYDLNPGAASKLANLSTRSFVSTGSDVMIAGFLLSNGNGESRGVVRGIGPSLAPNPFPASAVLANPTLELRDGNGALLISNNDWQDDAAQAALITAAGLAPTNNLESAIAASLPPGLYTAILAGFNNGTGIGLVEVYDLGP